MKRLSNAVLWMALALGASGAMATTMRCGGTVIDDEQLVPAIKALPRPWTWGDGLDTGLKK
jgi:hypothetical protein